MLSIDMIGLEATPHSPIQDLGLGYDEITLILEIPASSAKWRFSASTASPILPYLDPGFSLNFSPRLRPTCRTAGTENPSPDRIVQNVFYPHRMALGKKRCLQCGVDNGGVAGRQQMCREVALFIKPCQVCRETAPPAC